MSALKKRKKRKKKKKDEYKVRNWGRMERNK